MNKKPAIINEKDIVKITVTDGSAFTIYNKDPNDDKQYFVTYEYIKESLGDDYNYCSICGNIWKSDRDSCIHNCDEDDRQIYYYYEIADIIYDSLEDDLIVIILDKYNNKYNLKL